MNRIKAIVYLTQRGYKSTNRNQSFRFKKGNKSNFTEKKLYRNYEEVDLENNEDDNDPDNLEADFMSVDETYDEHNREVRHNKELLKARIIKSKYFKSKDPSFLTWSERSQIKALHNKDSQEWTPERLSTAFPALPETIKKIIKTSYMPKTAEAVIKYDRNVVNNWNQFKAGNLKLDPQLVAHLEKFKNRNIQAINLESIAEQFVKPKPFFPSPTSKLFTNMVKDCIESTNVMDNKPLLQANHDPVQENTKSSDLVIRDVHNKIRVDKTYITSDAFLEKKIGKITDHSNLSVEDAFFIQEYKDKKSKEAIIDSEQSIDAKHEKSLEPVLKDDVTEFPGEYNKTLEPHTMQDDTPQQPVKQIPSHKIELYRNTSETGIIKWERKSASDKDKDYPRYIKVPYQKAKKGVTFRVKDCYYDCDGEFLYRIPGIKMK